MLQSQAYEFQFGLEYAWTMCIFSVSMTYSITCPIIVPFGEFVVYVYQCTIFTEYFSYFLVIYNLDSKKKRKPKNLGCNVKQIKTYNLQVILYLSENNSKKRCYVKTDKLFFIHTLILNLVSVALGQQKIRKILEHSRSKQVDR